LANIACLALWGKTLGYEKPRRMLDNRLLKIYFKPKIFEQNGRSSIYKYIGINFFKKYLPTSGDLIYRYVGKRHLKFDSSDRCQKLLRFEVQTRKWEFRHIIGMVFFLIIALIINKEYKLIDYLVVGVLFLLVNIYPILLQRHNRIRIISLLKRQQHVSPYD
jgi:hypothetical protein